MTRSIRARLLVGTVLGVALTFAIAGVLVFALARSQMRAQFDRLVFVSRFRFTRERGLQATVEENQNAPQGR